MVSGKIVVLGTGGTIAGKAAQAGDNIGYAAGQVGVADLLAGVPGLAARVGDRLVAEQVAQIDSKDMDWAVWLQLAQRCAAHLADPLVQGVVVTHGTDTLEETAWFLAQVLDTAKPVALTCAMRPATALAPDGPQNLLDAVALALAPGAQGVVAVVAGEIHDARHVRKCHTYRVNAFTSDEVGPLGWMEEGVARLARPWPAQRQGEARVQAWDVETPPWVELVSSHAGADGRVVEGLVRAGVQGLVVAATGNGTVHHALEAALVRAQGQGVAVVRASRCTEGQILPKAGDALPASDGLSPVKARIGLMLQLLATGR